LIRKNILLLIYLECTQIYILLAYNYLLIKFEIDLIPFLDYSKIASSYLKTNLNYLNYDDIITIQEYKILHFLQSINWLIQKQYFQLIGWTDSNKKCIKEYEL